MWSEVTVKNSTMDFWTVTFSNWLCFWTVTLKDILTQYYHKKALLQGLKHNSVHMPSLNLTHMFRFESRFCMFIMNIYFTQSKRFQSLALHKKWSFPLRISSVNMTKSIISCFPIYSFFEIGYPQLFFFLAETAIHFRR